MDEQMMEKRIIDVDLQNEMRKSFLDYSMSVIVARALPRLSVSAYLAVIYVF